MPPEVIAQGSVGLCMTRIGTVRAIWDEVLFKVRVSFDGIVIRKKVLPDSSPRIGTNLDLVVKVLEVQRSVSFEFCLDEEFIEF